MQFDPLFSKTYPVPERECDADGKCRLPYLLRCMEDAAFADAERIGQSSDLLREKYDISWMIYQNVLDVTALPEAGSRICVQTCYGGVQSAAASRRYDVLQNGKPLIRCIQVWVVVHMGTRKLANPQKLPELMQPGFPHPSGHRRTLRAEPSLQHAGVGSVDKGDLDFNGHMNNVRYVEHALPYLPEGCFTGSFRLQLEYRYELLQGQHYDCLMADTGDTKQVVFRADGKDCFLLQISAG